MAETEKTTASPSPEEDVTRKQRLKPLLRKLLWCAGNLMAGVVLCTLFLRWQQPAATVREKVDDGSQTSPVNAPPLFDGASVDANAATSPDTPDFDRDVSSNNVPSPDEVSASFQSDPSQVIVDPLAEIDSLIVAGSYKRAMLACNQLLASGNWDDSLELMYRCAIVRERLHNLESAEQQYSMMLDLGGDERLLSAARLGQARCLIELGRLEAARMLLYSQLLRMGERPNTAGGEALHACARLLGEDIQPPVGNTLDDGVIIHQIAKPDDKQLLESYRITLDPITPLAAGIHLLDRFSDHPDSVQIESHYASQSILQILNDMMEVLGYSTVMDETAVQTFKARSVTVSVRDMNLGIFLDALLEPSGYTWQVEAKRLKIQSLSELSRTDLRDLRIRQASRICRTALALFPDSPEALATYMVMGNVSFWTGEDADAVSAYRELERRADGRDPGFAVPFNLAKAYLRLNQRKDAREAFYRVIDTAHGQSIQSVAYAYVGRLFLEDNLPENATRELARGLAFATTDEVRRTCVETLAAAYLVEGNPLAANQTLMDHRDAIQQEPTRSHTAFVSALARSRVATGETDRLRRKRELTAALANVVPSRFFGSVGYYLIGRAFNELELVDQMEAVYAEGIAATQPHELRTAMMFAVANHLYESGRWNELDKWFTQFESSGSLEGIRWSRLHRAEIAYKSGRFDECLDRCYEALSIELSDDDKRVVLTLLGKIFERRGDYYKAALCFAGMIPMAAVEENTLP